MSFSAFAYVRMRLRITPRPTKCVCLKNVGSRFLNFWIGHFRDAMISTTDQAFSIPKKAAALLCHIRLSHRLCHWKSDQKNLGSTSYCLLRGWTLSMGNTRPECFLWGLIFSGKKIRGLQSFSKLDQYFFKISIFLEVTYRSQYHKNRYNFRNQKSR